MTYRAVLVITFAQRAALTMQNTIRPLDVVTTVDEVNESSSVTFGNKFTSEVPASSDDSDLYAFTMYITLKTVIGATGVVMNLFVFIILLGFMELKSKV
jgi:hypothetical protein